MTDYEAAMLGCHAREHADVLTDDPRQQGDFDDEAAATRPSRPRSTAFAQARSRKERQVASLKELKGRINSVKSTQKITKAKQMVAAAKLRRAQAAAEAARPYARAPGRR